MFQLRKILTNHRLLKPFFKTVIYSPYSLVKPKFEFSDKEYWDYRYSEELQLSNVEAHKDPRKFHKELDDDWEMRCEDWYMGFIEFCHVLIRLMPNLKGNILNVGSGVSEMPFYLYDLGYTNIVNLDYSEKAIEHLEKEIESRSIIMGCCNDDARNMENLEDEKFDYIIDKGTFDSIICSGDDDIFDYLMEVDRVLKKDGTFFLISHSDRVDLFRFFNWKIRLVKIPISHTEDSRELIQEKIDGILEEYKLHKKEKMDYERFKLKEKRVEKQTTEFPKLESPLIEKIDNLEEQSENYFIDFTNKIITFEEFKKLDNFVRYGDRNFDRLTSSDEDHDNEENQENLDTNIEFQMTDLELDECNPTPVTNTEYIAHLRYLLYEEAENEIYEDYDVEEIKDEEVKEEPEIKEDAELDENDFKEINEAFTDTDSDKESGQEEEKEEKVRFLEGESDDENTVCPQESLKKLLKENEESNNPEILNDRSILIEKEINITRGMGKTDETEKNETENCKKVIDEKQNQEILMEIDEEKELDENVKRYSELISDLSSDEEASLEFEKYLDEKLDEDIDDEEEEADERIKNMKVDEYYYFYSIKKL